MSRFDEIHDRLSDMRWPGWHARVNRDQLTRLLDLLCEAVGIEGLGDGIEPSADRKHGLADFPSNPDAPDALRRPAGVDPRQLTPHPEDEPSECPVCGRDAGRRDRGS
jgi:hypothetical protein